MKLKSADPKCKIFKDSKGNIIQKDDKLKCHIDRHMETNVVSEENGELGIILKYGKMFVPLNTLYDEFFEKCEIIKN